MARQWGLLLTFLQIPFATAFPHRGRVQFNPKGAGSAERLYLADGLSVSPLPLFSPSIPPPVGSPSFDVPSTSTVSDVPTAPFLATGMPLAEPTSSSIVVVPTSSTVSEVVETSILQTSALATSVVPPIGSPLPMPPSNGDPSSLPLPSSEPVVSDTSILPSATVPLPVPSVPTSSFGESSVVPPVAPSTYPLTSDTLVSSSQPTVVPTSSFPLSSSFLISSSLPISSSFPVSSSLPISSSFPVSSSYPISSSFAISSSVPDTMTVDSTSTIFSTTTKTRSRSSGLSTRTRTRSSSTVLSSSTKSRTRTRKPRPGPTMVTTKTATVPKPGKSSSPPNSLTFPQNPTTTTVLTSTISLTRTRTRTRKSKTTVTRSPALAASPSGNPAVPSVLPTFTSTPLVTLATTLTVSEVQTVTMTETVEPAGSGVVHTVLNTSYQNTQQPFQTTVIATPKSSIRPITNGPNQISSTQTATPMAPMSSNIFVPIAKGAPPGQIPTNPDNPVPRTGIRNAGPIGTNKFYFNFFSDDRTAATWTHPYSVAWVAGQGPSASWGIAVSHVDRSSTVYGPGSPPTYFANPVGLQPVILSARELGGSTDLFMTNLKGFSCNVNLAPAPGAAPVITFPIVQGMGFVTGVYKNGTPMLQSNIYYSTLTFIGTIAGGIARYSATLNDGTVWLIYVTPKAGSSAPTLTLAQPSQILGNFAFSGTIQVAKVPTGSSVDAVRALYDQSAGVYPTQATIAGSANNAQGSYSLSWSKGGQVSKTLLMFALPHHVSSFSATTKGSLRKLKLDTTTKGRATAVYTDSWLLEHNDLPFDMGFAPWSPQKGSANVLSASAQALIRQVAAQELSEDFDAQTDLDSMYYSGKALAKFAFTVYATNNLAKDTGTASAGLVKLKNSFARFVNNQQIYPLLYDSAWGGVVSSCYYATGESLCDFGNSIYNDHHFHYGYFVYTAAVIAFLDPSWLSQGTNKAWVNMLVRDYANPVESDGYYPFQRNFDWFHGHSWAHGLFASFDGKDQESSSEDTFSLYAIKMWGRVTGDANMEARGNLLLAVQANSLQHYYLLQDNNKVQPAVFIPNKAAGIIFENKIDHTTYFGTNIEYIEGIHMLPLGPASTLTRTRAFVQQEWDTYFSDGRVDAIDSGWKGILYANYAIVNPVAAYNFFAQPGFQPQWLDGGASRTWYLAWAAGLGGAPS